jgi:hypothetical protein
MTQCIGSLSMEAEIFELLTDRDAASAAEGQGHRMQRPAANAVLTTAVDTWGQSWTLRGLCKTQFEEVQANGSPERR